MQLLTACLVLFPAQVPPPPSPEIGIWAVAGFISESDRFVCTSYGYFEGEPDTEYQCKMRVRFDPDDPTAPWYTIDSEPYTTDENGDATFTLSKSWGPPKPFGCPDNGESVLIQIEVVKDGTFLSDVSQKVCELEEPDGP